MGPARQAQARSAPPVVGEVLRSPGRALDSGTRASMEARFGADFSHVRVHTDQRAAASAAAVGAKAYTVGSHLVFGADRYAPGTEEGRRLLAHELAHVLQQPATTAVPADLRLGGPHDPGEREAEEVGAALGRAAAATRRTAPRPRPAGELGWVRRAARATEWGAPLPAGLAASMEARLHVGFGRVRVHPDSQAAAAMGARAYTAGDDVFFAPGHYDPRSPAGQGLIAHELAHVLQQRGGRATLDLAAPATAGRLPELEREADAAERTVAIGSGPDEVPSRRARGSVQLSPMDEFDELAATAAGGFEALVSWVLARELDPTLRRLADLRASVLRAGQPVVLSADMVGGFGRLYQSLRGEIPDFVPLPEATFQVAQPAAPLIIVAGVALGVLELALLLAMILLMLWILARTNPEVRRRQDRAVEELLDKLGEATRPKRAPAPKREPEPERERPPRPPPLWPDIDLEQEEETPRGCRIVSVPMQFGRHPCHADYAYSISKVRREFLVIPPTGVAVAFDARDRTGRLYEVKTGYAWVPNPNLRPPWRERRASVVDRFVTQALAQEAVAERCGLPLEWRFNLRHVAQFFNFLPPPVRHVPFDCDRDSDHTW